MQTYFSAKELAELKVPGLPGSARRIQMRAAEQGWARQRRGQLGGEIEYAIDALPLEAQRFIVIRQQAAGATVLAGAPTSAVAIAAVEAGGHILPELGDVVAEVASARTQMKAEARNAIIARRGAARVKLATKSERAQSKGYARSEVLQACDDWLKAQCNVALAASTKPMGQHQGEHLFCAEYNAGRIEVHPATRERLPRLSKPSLDRWRKRLNGDGLAGLADNHKGRTGTGKIDGDEALQAITVRQAVNNLHVRAPRILDEMRAEVREEGMLKHLWKPRMTRREIDAALPSESAILRWLRQLYDKDGNVINAIKDPDRHRGQMKSAFGKSDENITEFGQLWELDSTPGDILLADGKRYIVIGALDVWSRNAQLLVVPTAKATGLAAMFRKVLLDPLWGVPQTIRIDNGSDYVSKHMKDVYSDLEIDVWRCPPGQPQKKPFIERFFRTFSHSLLELLPGFVGHNVAERKTIESRQAVEKRSARKKFELTQDLERKLVTHGGDIELRLTRAQFQAHCDRWLKMYHQKRHETLGMTPFQQRASWKGELPRVPERALDVLLMEGTTRNVGKECITFERHTYGAAELGANWRGKMVRIKYDAADAGTLFVFHPEAENGFICKAICPEILGVPRAEIAAKISAADVRYYSDGKRRIKALASKANGEASAERILRFYEEQDSKLTLFRGPTYEHETAMLTAAALAVAGEPAPVPNAAPSDYERRIKEELQSGSNAKRVDEEPWERALRLEITLEDLGAIGETDLAWLERFRLKPAYDAVKWTLDDRREGGRAAI